MNISQISIRRYRAFVQQVVIPLSNFTVLTGPNNRGKSTVLSALSLLFGQTRRASSDRYTSRTAYNFEQDYPKQYQTHRGRRWPTRIESIISLTEKDIVLAKQQINTDIPNPLTLAVEMQLDEKAGIYRPHNEIVEIEDEQRSTAIARWVTNQLRYVYIPATRNIEDFRKSLFTELVEGAIQQVSQSKHRISLIEAFYQDVQKEIAEVEDTLVQELRAFIPSVNSVRFDLGELNLEELISVEDVQIDDGASTSIRLKGDGFKSLFVISMLQFIARQRFGQNLIFGIEEPEAHLHPSAIYEVKETLRKLSEKYQTLITTHSPILIQRDDLISNIIIELAPGAKSASSAKPAKKLSDIRQSLGIRPQDNMTTAEVVVIVEGATEETCLGALVSASKSALTEAINAGRVRVLGTNGASNMVAVVRSLARDATSCILLLDSDEEGDLARKIILNTGLIDPSDLFQVASRLGCRETEFEDAFEPKLYLEELSKNCGVHITSDLFLSAQKRSGSKSTKAMKWSQVMGTLFAENGKNWENLSDKAKTSFAQAVVANVKAINTKNIPWIRSIAERIVFYLKEG